MYSGDGNTVTVSEKLALPAEQLMVYNTVELIATVDWPCAPDAQVLLAQPAATVSPLLPVMVQLDTLDTFQNNFELAPFRTSCGFASK